MFFDERFNYLSGQYRRTTGVKQDDNLSLYLTNIQVPKNGYAYIYISNESDEPVYFDNVNVALNRGRIIEEDHYYAYGLKIAAISSTKLGDVNEGNLDNKNLYNDKELFDDADLDWYDYGFRNYDAQIGRFTQLDPLTWDYPDLTNYQYASNEPIANVDMDGLEKVGVCGVADWFHEGENVVSSSATKALASAGSKNIASAASKGFSLTQLGLNAIKIAAGVVRGQMAAQTINQRLSNPIVQQQVTDAVFDFYKANQNNMSFLEYMKLGILTNNYFNGLNLMAWWSGTDFLKLDRNVISGSEGHISDIKRIAITEAGIEDEQIGMYGIIGEGASTSLFISAMGLFPEVGAGIKLPKFNSIIQQKIVNAADGATSRISANSLKEFKTLVNQLSKPGSQLTKDELQQFEKLTQKFGGKLRYDLNPVKGKILKPHVQVEGLGQRVEGRKIWLTKGVK